MEKLSGAVPFLTLPPPLAKPKAVLPETLEKVRVAGHLCVDLPLKSTDHCLRSWGNALSERENVVGVVDRLHTAQALEVRTIIFGAPILK